LGLWPLIPGVSPPPSYLYSTSFERQRSSGGREPSVAAFIASWPSMGCCLGTDAGLAAADSLAENETPTMTLSDRRKGPKVR